VKSVGLVVSDGLTSTENAFVKVFPKTPHQLCVVHFKINITTLFPYKHRFQINDELKEGFRLVTSTDTPIDGFNRL